MSKPEKIQFWLLIILAFALRLFLAWHRPLDGDEGVIGLITDGSFRDVFTRAANDVHPPLFHLLVWGVRHVIGTSALSLRLVGILAGTGLVTLAPALAARFKTNWKLLGLLLATSPFLVYMSQDARMYSLFILIAISAWLVMTTLTPKSPSSTWLAWTAINVALVYTHHLGWLVVFFELITVCLSPAFKSLSTHRLSYLVSRISAVLGLLFLTYLPQLGTTVMQFKGRLIEQSMGAGLLDRISGLIGAFYRMLAGRTFLSLNPHSLVHLAQSQPLLFVAFLATFIVPLGLVLVGVRKLSIINYQSSILIGLSLIVGLAIGTIAIQASRYLSYLAPFLLAFLALGLQKTWPSVWGKLAAVVVALTILAGLWTQYTVHDLAPGLDVYAAEIAAKSEPSGDVVVLRGSFGGGETWAFRRYLDRAEAIQNQGNPYPHTTPVIDMYADYKVGNLAQLRARQPIDKAVELLKSNQRVWFFDQTYAPNPLAGLPAGYEAKANILGYDKEHLPLTLWLVTKTTS